MKEASLAAVTAQQSSRVQYSECTCPSGSCAATVSGHQLRHSLECVWRPHDRDLPFEQVVVIHEAGGKAVHRALGQLCKGHTARILLKLNTATPTARNSGLTDSIDAGKVTHPSAACPTAGWPGPWPSLTMTLAGWPGFLPEAFAKPAALDPARLQVLCYRLLSSCARLPWAGNAQFWWERPKRGRVPQGGPRTAPMQSCVQQRWRYSNAWSLLLSNCGLKHNSAAIGTCEFVTDSPSWLSLRENCNWVCLHEIGLPDCTCTCLLLRLHSQQHMRVNCVSRTLP